MIAVTRLLLSDTSGSCRLCARIPKIRSATPSASVSRSSTVSCELSASTAACPTISPRMQASVVPTRKPIRNAMPFVRGRELRMTTNVAVRTSGLAAATIA